MVPLIMSLVLVLLCLVALVGGVWVKRSVDQYIDAPHDPSDSE
jgi:hypothetical protein